MCLIFHKIYKHIAMIETRNKGIYFFYNDLKLCTSVIICIIYSSPMLILKKHLQKYNFMRKEI